MSDNSICTTSGINFCVLWEHLWYIWMWIFDDVITLSYVGANDDTSKDFEWLITADECKCFWWYALKFLLDTEASTILWYLVVAMYPF